MFGTQYSRVGVDKIADLFRFCGINTDNTWMPCWKVNKTSQTVFQIQKWLIYDKTRQTFKHNITFRAYLLTPNLFFQFNASIVKAIFKQKCHFLFSFFFHGQNELETTENLIKIYAARNKNTVSTNMKHCRYNHLMPNFSQIHFHTKRLYVHMFDIETFFNYGRGLISYWLRITLGIF